MLQDALDATPLASLSQQQTTNRAEVVLFLVFFNSCLIVGAVY